MTSIRAAAPVAIAVVAACGASTRDVKSAREATYTGDAAAIFQIVADTVARKYEVEAADPLSRTVTTKPRWYMQDGSYDYRKGTTFVPEGPRPFAEINYAAIMSSGPPFQIDVTWHVVNRPPPMAWGGGAENPPMPGWVQDRADELAVEIHQRLRAYQTH